MAITVKELEQQIRAVEGVLVVIRVSEKVKVPNVTDYGKQFKRLNDNDRVKLLVERIRDILDDPKVDVVVINQKVKRVDVRSFMNKARG